MSSRENQAFGPYGEYIANEVARRYGASPEEDTQDGEVAYADVPDSQPTRYREGWLPVAGPTESLCEAASETAAKRARTVAQSPS